MNALGNSSSGQGHSWFEWLPLPSESSPGDLRFYTMSRASPTGLGMFISGMAFFAWWNVWPLVVLNFVGLLAWVIAMVSAKRGRILPSMALIYATASTAAAAAVVFVGWNFGGQYVLIAQMLATILNPWPRRVAWLLAGALVGLFIVLYHYARLVPPLYDVPEVQLAVANTLNIVATFGVACLLVAYPARVADRAEAELAAEHRRSERLLTNVLPVSVARRLKETWALQVVRVGEDDGRRGTDLIWDAAVSASWRTSEVLSVLERLTRSGG